MSAIWFTADLHIGHRKLAEIRGFGEDTDAHDAVLAANWDTHIRRDDQVWVLGDISLGRGQREEEALQWVRRRPGIKHLISGNHDGCHPHHSKAHKALRDYLEVFETVASAATLKVFGHRVLLSHFPYANDPDGDHTPELRYPEWRMPDTGRWLLHGHTHSQVQVRGRQIHVGLDAHSLHPVSLHWVEAQIRTAEEATECGC